MIQDLWQQLRVMNASSLWNDWPLAGESEGGRRRYFAENANHSAEG